MSRLLHSGHEAYRRYMQISTNDVFVFVEGKTSDRFVYSSIITPVCAARRFKVQTVLAEELGSGTGAKPTLVRFFRYLAQSGSLLDEFKGKRTLAAFFLDKDVDDVLGVMVDSNHVVYTLHYDIENDIYRNGDLAKAAAAAASFDQATVSAGLGDPEVWRRTRAELWREWVKLCLITRVLDTNCECNFGVQSRINTSAAGAVDPGLIDRYRKAIQAAAGVQDAVFARVEKRVSRIVDWLYARGAYDRVFKGKWYSCFLSRDVERIAAGRPYDARGLEPRLLTAVAATLDFRGAWADYFRGRMEELLGAM